MTPVSRVPHSAAADHYEIIFKPTELKHLEISRGNGKQMQKIFAYGMISALKQQHMSTNSSQNLLSCGIFFRIREEAR